MESDYNYYRIAEALNYITLNFKKQPNLNEVASRINLSPFHFQRLFTEWAGVSPKKFLQYTTISYAKYLLADREATLFNTSNEAGLSGTGRLHDLFVNIEGMTPGEYKNGGDNLTISYAFSYSHFGYVLIAATEKGICHISFCEKKDNDSLNSLKKLFPKAVFHHEITTTVQKGIDFFLQNEWNQGKINLHVRGTDFQLKVWEALLKIPPGMLSTYGRISNTLKNPKASRAVGNAIGSNPIAYLIPCHRVIQSTGAIGGYMWGPLRKVAILGWEAAKAKNEFYNF